jgi:hypothetical protein
LVYLGNCRNGYEHGQCAHCPPAAHEPDPRLACAEQVLNAAPELGGIARGGQRGGFRRDGWPAGGQRRRRYQ